MRIGLISDTHNQLDDRFLTFLESCDEVWHAGDLGSIELCDRLEAFKPFRAVYGNIDDAPIRMRYPENQLFECAGLRVLMTHIGGYPGKYNARTLMLIRKHRPDMVICGHSHILKVLYDHSLHHLHLNPGAAGLQGWHKVRTALRFEIADGKPGAMELFELPRTL